MDWGVLAYLGLASLVAVVRLGRVPAAGWVLLGNGLAAGLVLLVSRPGLGPMGRRIREVYPLLLALLLYGSLDLLTGHGAIAPHDRVVQAWEARLFGGQPSRTWWMESPSWFWSGFLHAVYASYYGLVAAGPVWFMIRGDQANLRRSVEIIATTFGICFVVFLLFPVAGPNYEFPHPPPDFRANAPARLVYALLERGSSYGAAFPSSHVAVALVAAVATLRGSRRLGLVLLVPAAILPFAVVYTQMHYAVDSVGGVLVAGAVLGGWWIGEYRLGKTDPQGLRSSQIGNFPPEREKSRAGPANRGPVPPGSRPGRLTGRR